METAEILWKLALFVLAFVGGLYLGVLFHELGHATVALLATRLPVELQVGTNDAAPGARLARLTMKLGLRGFRYGFTRYDRAAVSRGRQTAVALGGPAATLVWAGLLVWWALSSTPGSWVWIIGAAFFIANFRILMVVTWPFEYHPYKDKDEVWLSDTLDVWRLWRAKNEERRAKKWGRERD